MATNVTSAQIEEAIQTTLKAKERWQSFKQKAAAQFEETTKIALGILETGLAAYGVGVVRGKYGEIKLVNVPYELVASTGLHLASFGGLFGQQKNHVHNIANGILSGYLSLLGLEHGASMKKQGSVGALELIGADPQVRTFQNYSTAPKHQMGYSPGRPMSKEELDALNIGEMGLVEN